MRKHLNYANVMATVAVFMVLGGGAYAALKLPKDSVTSKQIKKGSVKKSDLAKNSVAAKQLSKQAVTGDKVAKDTLTGKNIDEATLGAVPNAGRVSGNQIQQISYSAEADTPPETLFSIAGLTVTASCPAIAPPGGVLLTATTDTDHSIIGLPEVVNGNAAGTDDDFNTGESLTVPVDDTTAGLSYGRGPDSSPVVTANFLANQWFGGGGTCKVVGTVISDG
jgi:hypothetical protein